ncbi:hypothetical protein [Rubrimonas cliftonensis]|uniref:Uncharacterized protein n=1 Tax=Rubrimonas cliftonensis TaxID=89524 RepID=A0A1H3YRL5_9RHOB|nr:hypothetical protein [Rubrimonas cliftonensis]SEA13851.1 hypothetical protein SAMN05444370_103206 [Rubrimonas cliftonensis]
MLRVSGDVVAALSSAGRRKLAAEIAEATARDHPEAVESEGGPEAFAAAAIEQAQALGLTTRGRIRAWARLRATHGADVASLPWVSAVLEDSALTPDERLSLIEDRALMREARG